MKSGENNFAHEDSSAIRQNIRCLIIQTAGQSELMQSLMALRAAKQLYPQLELHLIVRKEWQDSLSGINWLESVVALPLDDWMGPLSRNEKTLRQTMGPVARWISPLAAQSWDMVINWSFTEASSWLTALLPARHKLGFSRTRDCTFSCMDDWSIFIQSIIQQKIPQNIHLTDVYTTQLLTALQISYGEPRDVGNEMVTSKGFFQSLKAENSITIYLSPDYHWIGIQLGTLDEELLLKLCKEILKNHPDHGLVLMGDESQADFAKQIESKIRARHRLVNLTLKKHRVEAFHNWSTAIGRCRWIISGEHPGVHLAGVLGTRVLFVCDEKLDLYQKGPYGNGHLILLYPEKTHPAVESLYALWTYVSRGSMYERNHSLVSHLETFDIDPVHLPCRVLRSRIRTLEDGGGVVYDFISQHALRSQDWSSAVMGQLARLWYCGWVAPLGHELERARMSPELIQYLRQLEESVRVLKQLLDESIGTITLLLEKTRTLHSDRIMRLEDKNQIQELAQRLEDLDQLIDRVGALHEPLRGFSCMLKVVMHNLPGHALREVGQESARAYMKIKTGVDTLLQWISHTRQLVKPQAIKGGQLLPLERNL